MSSLNPDNYKADIMFIFPLGLEPLSASPKIAVQFILTPSQLKCAPPSLSINIQHDHTNMHSLVTPRNELIARMRLAPQVLDCVSVISVKGLLDAPHTYKLSSAAWVLLIGVSSFTRSPST